MLHSYYFVLLYLPWSRVTQRCTVLLDLYVLCYVSGVVFQSQWCLFTVPYTTDGVRLQRLTPQLVFVYSDLHNINFVIRNMIQYNFRYTKREINRNFVIRDVNR